jgi:hypothetical protein
MQLRLIHQEVACAGTGQWYCLPAESSRIRSLRNIDSIPELVGRATMPGSRNDTPSTNPRRE